jgi:hypothetical protein
MHKAFIDAPLLGQTAKVHNKDYGADGSSGGAAVAVMPGLAPLAVATDGGRMRLVISNGHSVSTSEVSNGRLIKLGFLIAGLG